MSESTPIEIRHCIVVAHEAGTGSHELLAALFGVGRATFNRLFRRHRETGDVAASPRGGNISARIQLTDTERLAQIVADLPGATLDQLTDRWRKRVSTKVSRSSILCGLKNHGITLQKIYRASEQLKPHIIRRRREFAAEISSASAKKLVFLDETGCEATMGRERTWAPASLRAPAFRSAGYFKNVTVVGAIRQRGPVAMRTLDGSMVSSRFFQFSRSVLFPAMKTEDVLVSDDLRAHRQTGIALLAEQHRIRILHLPPYSPEFNSVEMARS